MGWACGAYRWGEGVYRFLVGKQEGRRPLGRPRLRWVDNIRMDLQDVGCGYMDWIELAKDRDRWRTVVSAVMNLGVPWNAGNYLTSCKSVSFSRKTLHHGVSKYIIDIWYFVLFSITGMTLLKADNGSRNPIQSCETLQRKLYNCNTSVYFNRQCLQRQLIPTYANVPDHCKQGLVSH